MSNENVGNLSLDESMHSAQGDDSIHNYQDASENLMESIDLPLPPPNGRSTPIKRNENFLAKQKGRRINLSQHAFVHRDAGTAFEENSKEQESNLYIEGIDRDIPIATDIDCGMLDKTFVDICRRELNYKQLVPLQKRTIPILLAGRNLLVQAPTGSGKTAAFLFPAIQTVINYHNTVERRNNQPLVLILSNTSGLALQTYNNVCTMADYKPGSNISPIGVSVFCATKNGSHPGQGITHDIISGTTGKVKSFLMSRKLNLSKLQMLILDEADIMVDVAKFGEEVMSIYDEIPEEVRKKLCVGMFSATYEKVNDQLYLNFIQKKLLREEVGEDDNELKQSTLIVVYPSRGYIKQRIIAHGDECNKNFGGIFLAKINTLLGLLEADRQLHQKDSTGYFSKTTVIFVERKITCNYLSAYLKLKGFDFHPYSSDFVLADLQKSINLMADGKIQGVVATNKLSRGRDIPEVDHVIIFELTGEFRDYEHRIGRTGRLGHGGRSTVLFNKCRYSRDLQLLQRLYAIMRYHNQLIPRWMFNLNAEMNDADMKFQSRVAFNPVDVSADVEDEDDEGFNYHRRLAEEEGYE